MSSPIALVTGGNRGLGFATATALARIGRTAIIAGRTESHAREAAEKLLAEGLDVEWLVLDVTSRSSVDEAAAQVRQRHGRLDVLVNNAGVLPEATDPVQHEFADVDMFRRTFETNVFGAVAVTEAFLPLLRASRAASIVNVSSTMGSLQDQLDPESPYYGMVLPAYQSSKAALNSVTIGLGKKLAGTGIRVVAVCPGFVQTDLTPTNRDQAPLTADQAAATVVKAITSAGSATSASFVGESGPIPW